MSTVFANVISNKSGILPKLLAQAAKDNNNSAALDHANLTPINSTAGSWIINSVSGDPSTFTSATIKEATSGTDRAGSLLIYLQPGRYLLQFQVSFSDGGSSAAGPTAGDFVACTVNSVTVAAGPVYTIAAGNELEITRATFQANRAPTNIGTQIIPVAGISYLNVAVAGFYTLGMLRGGTGAAGFNTAAALGLGARTEVLLFSLD